MPYVGLVLTAAPAVVLAPAEFDPDRAALVIVGMIAIDTLVENMLSSMLMSRGPSLSPTLPNVEVERSG